MNPEEIVGHLTSAWEHSEEAKAKFMSMVPDFDTLVIEAGVARELAQNAIDDVRAADPNGYYEETRNAVRLLEHARTQADLIVETIRGISDNTAQESIVSTDGASDNLKTLRNQLAE